MASANMFATRNHMFFLTKQQRPRVQSYWLTTTLDRFFIYPYCPFKPNPGSKSNLQWVLL